MRMCHQNFKQCEADFKNTEFYGFAGVHDLRFTKIYTADHQIYGLLRAPRTSTRVGIGFSPTIDYDF